MALDPYGATVYGRSEYWNVGRLEDWNIGRLKNWKIGRSEDQNIEKSEDWNIGRSENWRIRSTCEIVSACGIGVQNVWYGICVILYIRIRLYI